MTDTQIEVFEEITAEFKSLFGLRSGDDGFGIDFDEPRMDAMVRQAISAGAKLFLKVEKAAPGYHDYVLRRFGYHYDAKTASKEHVRDRFPEVVMTSYDREPIHAWMEREHFVSKEEWDEMVDRAADRFLRESHPMQSSEPAPKFSELDPIGQDEVGGAVERILASAYGWTTYVSKPIAEPPQ